MKLSLSLLLGLILLGCLNASAQNATSAAAAPVNTALQPRPKLENDSYNWETRHAAVLDWQKKNQAEVVLIGDSITHFWGGEPVSKIQRGPRAWQATFGERKVLNLGFGWDRTQNVLWRLEHGELDGQSPKVIILNIGTNNFSQTKNARMNSPEEVCAAIQEICRRLKTKSPQSRIVVMGVFPRAREPHKSAIPRLNSLLAEALKNDPSVRFLDITAQWMTPEGDILPGVCSDGVHPNEKGYAIWGRALQAAGVW